ncbi:DUF6461 domain-containing protein [Streptomyces sp. GESEQ-35]|uniref:DUF6461 domain-containing protein n=1 Tax=Streptomyces sp. GESEQ-35 TaxID=2812657 RepID=UPI001B335397|nr:DUF6461 domain-containing protein [Streptomyces sp. GESEQ-35]
MQPSWVVADPDVPVQGSRRPADGSYGPSFGRHTAAELEEGVVIQTKRHSILRTLSGDAIVRVRDAVHALRARCDEGKRLDGIRWLATAEEVNLGYWVLFVRGLPPADLLTRLGLDVDPDQVLTREEAGDLADETDDVVVRAGASGRWAYAFVEGGPAGPDSLDRVRQLSTGTDAIDMWRTVNADMSLGYAEDGRLVCRFEPGREHERTGDDPDRLAGAMREAGLLLPDGRSPYQHGVDVVQPELRALGLAESVFGLDLPRAEVLEGPLLAARLQE